MFLNHLYGGVDEPESKIVDVFICKLRKKLASASGGNEFIETVWARGYMLSEPTAAAATTSNEVSVNVSLMMPRVAWAIVDLSGLVRAALVS
jgi:two-component system, cell cycle response regulator CtrA